MSKSHRPTAQIPSSQCLSCSNFNPIPIFYCFFVDESQSQCMKSHFPSQKMGKSQFPFYPFRTLLRASTPVMIYPHRASCKICQTTVGIKPATFGLLVPGSVSRGLNIIVDDIVILYKHRMILLVDKISDILFANQMIMKYTPNISILKLGI